MRDRLAGSKQASAGRRTRRSRRVQSRHLWVPAETPSSARLRAPTLGCVTGPNARAPHWVGLTLPPDRAAVAVPKLYTDC